MIKELIALTLLTASNGACLNEPQRAIYTNDYKIINATGNDIQVYTYYNDEEYDIDSTETTYYIPMDSSSRISVLTNVRFYGYCYLAPDSEELVPLTWTASTGTYSWYATIEGYEPSQGIGFYNRTPIPTDVDFYIDQNKLGIFNTNSSTGTNESGEKLLPDNTTVNLFKEDGSALQLSDLRLWRYKTNTNNVAVCIWYDLGYAKAIVAMNFYVPNINGLLNYEQFKEQADKSNSISPQLMFYAGFTNKLRFNSGYYSFAPNEQGYNLPYYLTSTHLSYLGINNDGSTAETTTFEVLTKTFTLISQAMITAVSFMSYMVFPGITIGFLVLLPLIISLLIVILKMVKKG